VKCPANHRSLRSDGFGLRCRGRGIREYNRGLGHVTHHRCQPAPGRGTEGRVASRGKTPQTAALRNRRRCAFHERTTVERVNGRLKGEFGARMVRARGNAEGDVSSYVRHRRAHRRPDSEARHLGRLTTAEATESHRQGIVAACLRGDIFRVYRGEISTISTNQRQSDAGGGLAA